MSATSQVQFAGYPLILPVTYVEHHKDVLTTHPHGIDLPSLKCSRKYGTSMPRYYLVGDNRLSKVNLEDLFGEALLQVGCFPEHFAALSFIRSTFALN